MRRLAAHPPQITVDEREDRLHLDHVGLDPPRNGHDLLDLASAVWSEGQMNQQVDS